MKNTFERSGFIFYPSPRFLRVIALVVFFLFSVLSRQQVFAQSDESVARESRQRALMCQNNGEFKKALFYYERALALQPGMAALYNDIGLMNEYLGHTKEAEENYLKAISLDYNYLPAYANAGAFYSKLGQYSLAARYLRERVARGRTDDQWTRKAQAELMNVYRQAPGLNAEHLRQEADEFSAEILEARLKLKQSAERNKTMDFEAAYKKGVDAFKARRFNDAVEALETAVALNPRSTGASEALVRARFANDKSYLEHDAMQQRADIRKDSISETLDHVSSQ
jgi:tetratricopeptide (TPR) repeat protein